MMKSFCRWLVDQFPTGDLVLGDTLHRGFMPQDAPDLCTVVREPTPGRTNPYLDHRTEKSYQLLTRGPSYTAAETEARRIYAACINLRAIPLTAYAESGEDVFTVLITEGNEPAFLTQDAKSRFVFSANLTLRVKREN